MKYDAWDLIVFVIYTIAISLRSYHHGYNNALHDERNRK